FRMTAPQLEAIITAATSTLTDWNSFIDAVSSLEGPDRIAFDLEKAIPNLTPTTSIDQLGRKLSGAIGLTHSLSGIESIDLIPDLIVNEVSARVSATRAAVEKSLAQVNGLEKDSEITALDPAGM